jgi:hypothetical protein
MPCEIGDEMNSTKINNKELFFCRVHWFTKPVKATYEDGSKHLACPRCFTINARKQQEELGKWIAQGLPIKEMEQ